MLENCRKYKALKLLIVLLIVNTYFFIYQPSTNTNLISNTKSNKNCVIINEYFLQNAQSENSTFNIKSIQSLSLKILTNRINNVIISEQQIQFSSYIRYIITENSTVNIYLTTLLIFPFHNFW